MNLKRYMGDAFHAYPTTLAHEILLAASQDAELGDEVYCQIIKQGTNCPTMEGRVRCWKMLLFCLHAFTPSERILIIVQCFIAEGCPEQLDNELIIQAAPVPGAMFPLLNLPASGMVKTKQLATLCYSALTHSCMAFSKGEPLLDVPNCMPWLQAITAGADLRTLAGALKAQG
jgi:hypothetical protein